MGSADHLLWQTWYLAEGEEVIVANRRPNTMTMTMSGSTAPSYIRLYSYLQEDVDEVFHPEVDGDGVLDCEKLGELRYENAVMLVSSVFFQPNAARAS